MNSFGTGVARDCNVSRRPCSQWPEVEVMIIRHCRLSLLLLLVLPTGAHAQGLILPRPLPNLPRLPALSVKRHHIQVTLEAGTARTEVEQVFVNPTDRVLEGTYIFPLPEDAAVSQFRMTIDKEPVEGKVLDREEARRIYEEYVDRKSTRL